MKYWSKITKTLTPYVPGEQLNEPGIIKLNTNENPFPPSPKVIEKIKKCLGSELKKYPDPESTELRNSIADFYEIEKDNVFVGNGSDEVLAHVFMAFFKDKKLYFPDITYSFYPVYCGLYEINYQTISLNKKFEMETKEYLNLDGNIIFPNPNAPTGIGMELDAIEKILKNNPGNLVVVDEAYIDFGGKSAVELIDNYKNLLIVQTFSKSRSLAGMRIGFAIGDEKLIEGLIRVKDSFNSYPLDRLAQAAGKAAMEDRDYFEYTRDEIIKNREWTISELRMRGMELLPSKANFIFVRVKDAENMYRELKARKILVRYFKKPLMDSYLRISIGTKEEMGKLIKNIDQIMGV
ncbi:MULTISPECIES: histidinol-phosphate transaminase [Psychrilyobacter]|uniref:Histidinol-phosphate aminotransferase n=1 Tax=Psychrilyobacter piezotolerans TaxID=2293438 RepID=A0ABX9KE01_9FUSO|nr:MULTISPECIES: histidinol-phosphate transaminase [Psychrilyobacter]MCS5422003.1 histidinol-phosphate transaminase [Psychrilyobacter sp. S5]NDI78937.1 histidinol-phosphate transaminase [Psychrilyobacter piezotolerans]RDE59328.1 histidinol-phosphate transaminase [Psychrilyobacter sp. S5]REI39858.1 histidinol-phosphate transaminase [Psychrilyobacter piezotolerans]